VFLRPLNTSKWKYQQLRSTFFLIASMIAVTHAALNPGQVQYTITDASAIDVGWTTYDGYNTPPYFLACGIAVDSPWAAYTYEGV
jgi:hypothetical protein